MNQFNYEHFYREVGRLIQSARKSKNISQEDLAKRIGLTRTSVTNIEKGRQKILLHTLVLISKELSVEVNKLIPSTDEPYIDILDSLPLEHQKAVKKALNEKE